MGVFTLVFQRLRTSVTTSYRASTSFTAESGEVCWGIRTKFLTAGKQEGTERYFKMGVVDMTDRNHMTNVSWVPFKINETIYITGVWQWKSSNHSTGLFGGEHDDEGLSAEGVCATGLTAVIVGVVFSHGYCLLPGEERYYLATSAPYDSFIVVQWLCLWSNCLSNFTLKKLSNGRYGHISLIELYQYCVFSGPQGGSLTNPEYVQCICDQSAFGIHPILFRNYAKLYNTLCPICGILSFHNTFESILHPKIHFGDTLKLG